MSHVARATLLAFIVAGLVSGVGRVVVRADGGEFYQPADEGPIDLVYFGLIKGSDGRPLDDVEIEVNTEKELFRVMNDKPGHFRTPDIGNYYKNLGEQVNLDFVQITVNKPGYESVTKKVP